GARVRARSAAVLALRGGGLKEASRSRCPHPPARRRPAALAPGPRGAGTRSRARPVRRGGARRSRGDPLASLSRAAARGLARGSLRSSALHQPLVRAETELLVQRVHVARV